MNRRFRPIARTGFTLALLLAAAPALHAAAQTPVGGNGSAENKPTTAFAEFQTIFAKVEDYKVTIVGHETTDDAKESQDRTYAYAWKRPSFAKIDVIAGAGKGSGAVWRGGDAVTGHQGGFLSGFKRTVSINDPRATSLRGDKIDVASFDWVIRHYLATPGTLAQAAGPDATTVVTLTVKDPAANRAVSKDQLSLSDATHMPVKRDQFVGTVLVKTETYKDLQINPGLSSDDF